MAQKEILLHAQQNQVQYGKWVLASLLAVQAGALLAITHTGSLAPSLFLAAGRYLIWGVVATLFAGGLAWINFTIATVVYAQVLAAIRNGDEPQLRGPVVRVAQMILYVAPLFAVTSLVLFVIAAHEAVSTLNSAAEAIQRAEPGGNIP